MKNDTRIKLWLCVALTVGIATIAVDRVLFPASPVATWTIAEARGAEPYTSVAPETEISLDLSLPQESWVYAVSYDLDRGMIALFPSGSLLADLRQNPAPAGNHRLPGSHQGKQLFWHSGDMPGSVEFLIVVSDHPIPELEETMGLFRQMGNAAFPMRTKLGVYAPKDGMKVVPARREFHTAAFRAAHVAEDPQNDGSFVPWPGNPGVYLKSMQVQNKRMGNKATKSPSEQIKELSDTFLSASKSKDAPATGEISTRVAAPPSSR